MLLCLFHYRIEFRFIVTSRLIFRAFINIVFSETQTVKIFPQKSGKSCKQMSIRALSMTKLRGRCRPLIKQADFYGYYPGS